jgi:hypothetical protein
VWNLFADHRVRGVQTTPVKEDFGCAGLRTSAQGRKTL